MIEIKNLNKYYPLGREKFHALKDINLSIGKDEMVALTGKSGAGKTTLLNIIGGLDTFDSGEYIFDGKNVNKLSDMALARFRNEKVGFVVQDFALISDQSVLYNVSLPLLIGKGKYGEIKPRAIAALDKVGLLSQMKKKINQLSGGQKQRIAIARAMVNNPSVLLSDEPTGALDSETGKEIMELMRSLNKTGVAVIIVTHDSFVRDCCDRSIEISDGAIV